MTGSILKHNKHQPQLLVYELVVRNPSKGHTPLPVATYVTEKQDINSILGFFNAFLSAEKKYHNQNPVNAQLIVCDGGTALVPAVLDAFMKETKIDYLRRCYKVFTGSADIVTI